MLAYIIGGASLTAKSELHVQNTRALLAEEPLYSDKPITVGPHTIQKNGQISSETLSKLLTELPIPRKNEKFFEEPSIALYYCVEKLRATVASMDAEDLALYVNLGPANTRLEEFEQWASENSASGTEPFTSMRASSVIKLLPNVVMSNLSINLGIGGENTVTSGTSVSSALVLQSAIDVLDCKKAKAAFVASASFPYRYFNIDSYLRFFGEDFFVPPLCEGASACLLVKQPEEGQEVLGAIRTINTYKKSASWQGDNLTFLSEKGFQLGDYEKLLVSPSQSGNFLAATEPFALLALLDFLKERAPGKMALSVSSDIFGNVSAIEVEGPVAAQSKLSERDVA